jgi:chorismate mutase/prephenate dehydratase
MAKRPTKPAPTGPVAAADRSRPVLADLRHRIDRLDRQIIEALSQRAQLVVEVGKLKQAHGIPIYAPHREAEVLRRVLAHNTGPLSDRTIEGVYRELMSGSFALEKPLTIGYLGPAGSFSHLAAVRHFGSSVSLADLHAIDGVFTEVQRGHVDYGMVPIENSIHGGVTETLDGLTASAGKLHVYAEVQLAVHHALLATCPPAKVRRIMSKPEVFSQCRTWLATQYPKAELVGAASSAKAVQDVAQAGAKGARDGWAAIGSTLAGELYGLNILFDAIEDDPSNITRFFVLSRQEAKPSGDDKTSMLFVAQNKPGALARVLSDFHSAGVNLTHIDKRPSRRKNWSYTFFIDAEGHHQDASVKRAIAKARRHCQELHVLGSYPRSKRVL